MIPGTVARITVVQAPEERQGELRQRGLLRLYLSVQEMVRETADMVIRGMEIPAMTAVIRDMTEEA